jgi:hypothetical protein
MNEMTQEEQSLLETFEKAPVFIQEFISSGEFSAFIERLATKLSLESGLRAGISNELFMTLLGITSPTELPDNLRDEAGVPEELVPLIIEEAREGIFEPLIAQGGGASAPDLPVIIPEKTETLQRETTATRPNAAPSPLSSFHANLAPTPVPQATSASSDPAPQPQQTPKLVPTATHPLETFHARTMASDIEAMGGMQKVSATPVRPIAPPPAPPRYAPVVATEPVPAQTPQPAPISAAQSVHTDLKEYGIDPYREPVE